MAAAERVLVWKATDSLLTIDPRTHPPTHTLQWSVDFVATLNASVDASPNGRTVNGGFITSCMQHGQQEQGMWDVEKVGGVSMRDALGAWYRGDAGSAGKWPGNPTCVGVNSR